MANLCDGESERVARWRERNWNRDLRPADVEAIINALMHTERENAVLREQIDIELGIYSPRFDARREINKRTTREAQSERVQRLRACLLATVPADGG